MSLEPAELIECVPNISEGLDPAVVDAITAAAEGVAGAALLHVDRGEDAHRTVLTLAGRTEPLEEMVFRIISGAAERIDLRRHTGTHPRIGATDVVPFVPLSGVDMAHCVRMAERLGRRVAAELDIPVFLYQHAARQEQRRELSSIRRGGFEGLADKLQQPEWAPDFGSATPHPSAGATVIGARDFLVAFNVHLESTSVQLGRSIAKAIRTRFPAVRAIGWNAPRYGLVQVSTNLMSFRVTGLYEVYETIAALARESGVEVGGSEIIGLVPETALVVAGARVAGLSSPVIAALEAGAGCADPLPGVPAPHTPAERDPVLSEAERETLIEGAIEALGLSRFSPFKAQERILERRLHISFGWAPRCL